MPGRHDDEFQGSIGRTYRVSEPWWSAPPAAPAGAPNIVFVVLDDVGFSDLSCYGSEIATPRMDALAAAGLRYSNFHVTSMCSPTRACLLTGRNAHSVGVGAIAEWSSGFPAYQGRITKRAATVAEILAEQAYGTYAIGKWHLANLANYVAAGPHEDWPLGRGFSRWYGFLGGYVDHWHPDLHVDNHAFQLEPWDGYHLTCDLIDHAIGHVRDHVTSAGGRPFFLYLALGAAHWPHQAPADFIARYRGRYDMGWDAVREARLERQKALGIVPAHTRLPPRNPGVEPWDNLPVAVRSPSARFQEAYAGFLEHADTEIGRFVDYLAAIGQLDNTAIVVLSDNGASGEGGATGAVNIRKHLMHEKETPQQQIAHLDRIGGEFSFSHYPMGWAQVSNTPLKWYKKNTHGGGIRAPLIVHWPNRIKQGGVIGTQYHHVIDIVPTFLEMLGIEAPASYSGVPQLPTHGVSMAYTFDDPAAPTRKQTQHYELVGDRAIWHQGWKAVTRHTKGIDFEADQWELYYLDADFSEVNDLAAEQPERLREMVDLWWSEAERFGVLPLDDRETERAFDWFKNNTPTRYEYLPGMARVDRLMIPAITDRSYCISADLDIASNDIEGVILSCGNRFGGFVLYCKDGLIVYEYVYTEAVSYVLRVPVALGRRSVTVQFTRTGKNAGRLGLLINNVEMGAVEIPKTWSTYGVTAGLTCGFAGAPVSSAYHPPFAFTGTIRRVVVDLVNDSGEDPREAAKAIFQEE
jgi:arylsulfatase